MGRLFGTDGVRGVANADLSPELAFRLGRAGAAVLTRHHPAEAPAQGGKKAGENRGAGGSRRPRVLIGRDTRISGEMLEAAMVAGLTSSGADVLRAGIVPTPAVAYLTRTLEADAGVMISASHNPVEDNGIKYFSGDGYKLSDALEEEIEALILDEGGQVHYSPDDGLPRPVGTELGRAFDVPDAAERVVEFLRGTVDVSLQGMKVVIDCGYGAAYQIAPRVFRELGAEVIALNAEPDGGRINVKCGSTHPAQVQKAVLENHAQLGLAHDGDADRVIAVDENGEIVDGDRILAICGLYLLQQGLLAEKAIAATVYSNMGLRETMERHGGRVVITKNGDRYVLEAMRKQGLVVGGEQSGHIIFLRHNTTGDGVLTALQLAGVLKKTGQTLGAAARQMHKFPQVQVAVRVKDKGKLATSERVGEAISRGEELLADSGRILVRASGTEPVIRVMGEGKDEAVVREVVDSIARTIRAELS